MILIEAFIIISYNIRIKNKAKSYSIIIFLDLNFLALVCNAKLRYKILTVYLSSILVHLPKLAYVTLAIV